MAKGYPYAFNMGNGNIISYQNYQEAGKTLMERSFPDVLHNRQTNVVLIPETNLPKVPRAVDLQKYETKKKNFDDKILSSLGMRKGNEDITNAQGDIAERYLAEELRKFFANALWKHFRV